VACGAKPNYIERLCVVFVMRLDKVGGLAIAAWLFLELSSLESPFDGIMSPSLFGVVPPVGAASLVSVFLMNTALPHWSLFSEPRMDAEILLAADVRAEAPLTPRDGGRAFVELRRALFAGPFHHSRRIA
jgi:hypothetical protein